jgi:hypothetical protein
LHLEKGSDLRIGYEGEKRKLSDMLWVRGAKGCVELKGGALSVIRSKKTCFAPVGTAG